MEFATISENNVKSLPFFAGSAMEFTPRSQFLVPVDPLRRAPAVAAGERRPHGQRHEREQLRRVDRLHRLVQERLLRHVGLRWEGLPVQHDDLQGCSPFLRAFCDGSFIRSRTLKTAILMAGDDDLHAAASRRHLPGVPSPGQQHHRHRDGGLHDPDL